MPYLWEQPNLGNNLYEMAINRRKALLETENSPAEPTVNSSKDDDIESHIELDVDATKAGDKSAPVDTAAKADKAATETRTGPMKDELSEKEDKPKEDLDALTKYAITLGFSKDLALQIKNVLDNVNKTGTFDGKNENKAAQKLASALKSGNTNVVKKVVEVTGKAIKDGKIQFDEKNPQLYTEQKEDKSVVAPVEMPALFQSEPDDTMWQDIVVTAYGIPLINMDHPVSKNVLASENPEEECPNDLKQFKKAVYGNKRLQNVFGKGGFIDRICAGKLTNLLTLGIAAATVDAGKRADRIIKELKDKGGMTTHRNLLIAKYENIVDADPDNEGATVVVRPYNRSRGELMGDIEVPASMLNRFYSVVDPTQSTKAYLEIYAKDKSLMENSGIFSGDALIEGPISAIKKGASAIKKGAKALAHDINTKGDLSTMFKGDDSKNAVNQPTKKEKADKDRIANLKAQFIEKIQEIGHPPYYVLKPKTANKEIDIVSNGSTGQFHGGKVLMVTMRIDEHKAAAFMTPKEVKQYFAL